MKANLPIWSQSPNEIVNKNLPVIFV